MNIDAHEFKRKRSKSFALICGLSNFRFQFVSIFGFIFLFFLVFGFMFRYCFGLQASEPGPKNMVTVNER